MNPTHPHPRWEPRWREVPSTAVPAPDHGPDGPWEVGRLQATWWDETRRPPKPVVGSEPSPVPAAPRGSPVELPCPAASLAAFPGRCPRLPWAPKNRSPPVPTCPRIQAGAHRTTQSSALEGRSLGTESRPAKGYDFCCDHLAQDPCCGEPGPPGSSALATANPTFLKLRGHL